MHERTYMRLRARDLLLLKASVGGLLKRLSDGTTARRGSLMRARAALALAPFDTDISSGPGKEPASQKARQPPNSAPSVLERLRRHRGVAHGIGDGGMP